MAQPAGSWSTAERTSWWAAPATTPSMAMPVTTCLKDGRGDDLLVGSDSVPTPPGVQLYTPCDWVSYKDAGSGAVVNLSEIEPQETCPADAIGSSRS